VYKKGENNQGKEAVTNERHSVGHRKDSPPGKPISTQREKGRKSEKAKEGGVPSIEKKKSGLSLVHRIPMPVNDP